MSSHEILTYINRNVTLRRKTESSISQISRAINEINFWYLINIIFIIIGIHHIFHAIYACINWKFRFNASFLEKLNSSHNSKCYLFKRQRRKRMHFFENRCALIFLNAVFEKHGNVWRHVLKFEYNEASFYREQQSPIARVTYDLNYPRAQR